MAGVLANHEINDMGPEMYFPEEYLMQLERLVKRKSFDYRS